MMGSKRKDTRAHRQREDDDASNSDDSQAAMAVDANPPVARRKLKPKKNAADPASTSGSAASRNVFQGISIAPSNSVSFSTSKHLDPTSNSNSAPTFAFSASPFKPNTASSVFANSESKPEETSKSVATSGGKSNYTIFSASDLIRASVTPAPTTSEPPLSTPAESHDYWLHLRELNKAFASSIQQALQLDPCAPLHLLFPEYSKFHQQLPKSPDQAELPSTASAMPAQETSKSTTSPSTSTFTFEAPAVQPFGTTNNVASAFGTKVGSTNGTDTENRNSAVNPSPFANPFGTFSNASTTNTQLQPPKNDQVNGFAIKPLTSNSGPPLASQPISTGFKAAGFAGSTPTNHENGIASTASPKSVAFSNPTSTSVFPATATRTLFGNSAAAAPALFSNLATSTTTAASFANPVTSTLTTSSIAEPATSTVTTSSISDPAASTVTTSLFATPTTSTVTTSSFANPATSTVTTSSFANPTTATAAPADFSGFTFANHQSPSSKDSSAPVAAPSLFATQKQNSGKPGVFAFGALITQQASSTPQFQFGLNSSIPAASIGKINDEKLASTSTTLDPTSTSAFKFTFGNSTDNAKTSNAAATSESSNPTFSGFGSSGFTFGKPASTSNEPASGMFGKQQSPGSMAQTQAQPVDNGDKISTENEGDPQDVVADQVVVPEYLKAAGGSENDQEELLFEVRCRLHESEANGWKSLGIGPLTIRRDKATKRSRIVMQLGSGGSSAINSYLSAVVALYRPEEPKALSLSVLPSEGDSTKVHYKVQVKLPKDAKKIVELITELKSSQ